MKWTNIIILSWVLASFYAWSLPDSDTEMFLQDYAYSTENVAQGKVWVFVTSAFLHANFAHLFMNAIAFFFFGIALEEKIGYMRMLFTFFFGAFAGDVLSSVFHPAETLSIGASGGVSAVLGAAMLIAPFQFSVVPYPAPIILVGIIYIITNLLGFLGFGLHGISYAAHIGGMLFGLGYGFQKIGIKKGASAVAIGVFFYIILNILYSMFVE